ncbi:MAG: hypothetical protein HY204_11190 [Nitrospirae bacterium]|nr:hypothetical protein [Nitrospirota bacterium]
MDQKIVVRFQNGKIMKGYSHDFFPNKDSFHLNVLDQPPDKKPIEITVSQLKAIFFVKNFVGRKGYQELKDFSGIEKSAYGKKVIVQFKDGELLYGVTQGFSPNRSGFFLFPADQQSNNQKVFIVQSFVTKIESSGP